MPGVSRPARSRTIGTGVIALATAPMLLGNTALPASEIQGKKQ
jgi:hypothetical protein